MMHEREKSDPAVVAVKPVNNAERSAAEPVEPRAGAKGNAEQHSTCRAQYRVSVSQALERIRQVRRHSPEVGAVCGKAARTDLCGGRSEMSVPTAIAALAMTARAMDCFAEPVIGRAFVRPLARNDVIMRSPRHTLSRHRPPTGRPNGRRPAFYHYKCTRGRGCHGHP